MKMNFLTIGLFLASTLAASASLAQSGPARAQLEAFSGNLTTLHARFEQQVIGGDGAVQGESAGEVWLQRPQLFRWEYGGDFPELVVADGKSIWIYDETLEQVTVKDQSDAAVNSPLALLTDPAQLDEQFQVRELGEAEGVALLELRALSPETEFERVLLGLKDGVLVSMILEDAFGLRTEIRFSEMRRNVDIDAGLFRFQPPEGTDVIGDPRSLSESQ